MTEAFEHAKAIVAKLQRDGHVAYFAGGWVRDYIMGHPSDDIDIATDASPPQIMDLFSQTLLVGLAFGIVIVIVEGHQFEVATFRKDLHYIDGRHPQGILRSTPLEDALRRDFTINGMFYDPIEEVVHDYVHGREDIHLRVIRTIGDPYERFFEDRLRMLRAFRFAARFNFAIDLETQEAIRETTDKFFPSVSMERVWQEFNKMATYPGFDHAIVEMHRLALLTVIFPELEEVHLKDLREWVKPYAHFPQNCPTIFYLMTLFPFLSLAQKIDIARRIKASNKDIKLIEFLDNLHQLIEKDEHHSSRDFYEWVHLLVHPHCLLGLQVLASHYPDEQRLLFLQEMENLSKKLQPHVERFKTGKPLVSAALLSQHGIKPGKKMGLLLKEAERLAIQEDWHEPLPIMNQLMTLPLWKESQ